MAYILSIDEYRRTFGTLSLLLLDYDHVYQCGYTKYQDNSTDLRVITLSIQTVIIEKPLKLEYL